jgi:hypothetical protein
LNYSVKWHDLTCTFISCCVLHGIQQYCFLNKSGSFWLLNFSKYGYWFVLVLLFFQSHFIYMYNL